MEHPRMSENTCRQPEGPDAYHKFCLNTDHAGKEALAVMWKAYLEEFGENCAAAKGLISDNREGYRARKAKQVKAVLNGREVPNYTRIAIEIQDRLGIYKETVGNTYQTLMIAEIIREAIEGK
jgi:hypothetical protein